MRPILVIPTRNRPRKMAAMLSFIAEFYPGTRVAVADGSDPHFQDEVARVCGDAPAGVDVRFTPYPAAVPYFERILDAVQSETDDILSLTADDDYPLMDAYDKAADMLRADGALSLVVPYSIALIEVKDRGLRAFLMHAPDLRMGSAAVRLRQYARWRHATSYGVGRKDLLIARYRSVARVYCAGFVDAQVGGSDCIAGRIAGLAQLGAIRTQRYPGSYMRPADPLVFLRRSADMLGIIDVLTEQLAEAESLDPDRARLVVQRVMALWIRDFLDRQPRSAHDLASIPTFRQDVVQAQFAQFYDLFRTDTPMRSRYGRILERVGRIMLSAATLDESEAKGNYEEF